jgi:glucose-6-phosphate dehydrogenase assembly protein OpcA
VSDDVWSASDTTPDAIEAALRELLRERHAANRALAPARVLNMIVIVDRDWKGEISNRLERVGRYHASRTILCAVEDRRKTLDATVVMSYEDPADALGVIRESVEIDLGPEHLTRLDSVVDPVLAPELPTVLWAPHRHEEAVARLREMVDVRLLDSDQEPDPAVALEEAADALEWAYVVDLAWLRTVPWRERLAASFDPDHRHVALRQIDHLAVRHRDDSTVSALLLAGWLASRLGWDPRQLAGGAGGLSGSAGRNADEVAVVLEAVEQEVPGLAGVTVGCGGFELSLDRAKGGLCARERSSDGDERVWQVLGASRGEGGILGEGVRQALLRDRTYAPALKAARELAP